MQQQFEGADMNRAYEIIHKETGRVIGTYPTYEQACEAYDKLGWEASDHAIGEVL